MKIWRLAFAVLSLSLSLAISIYLSLSLQCDKTWIITELFPRSTFWLEFSSKLEHCRHIGFFFPYSHSRLLILIPSTVGPISARNFYILPGQSLHTPQTTDQTDKTPLGANRFFAYCSTAVAIWTRLGCSLARSGSKNKILDTPPPFYLSKHSKTRSKHCFMCEKTACSWTKIFALRRTQTC